MIFSIQPKYFHSKFFSNQIQQGETESKSNRFFSSTIYTKERGRIIEDNKTYDPLYLSASLFVAPHTSTCGHSMHADCWQTFFDNLVGKERSRRFPFRQPLLIDVELGEYLCPLCKRLSNCVLPVLPGLGGLAAEK